MTAPASAKIVAAVEKARGEGEVRMAGPVALPAPAALVPAGVVPAAVVKGN
jgi:hypothetical protein